MANKKQTQEQVKKPEQPDLISTAAAAGMCDMSVKTWLRYRSMGLVPDCVRVGGLMKWRRSDIERWIEMRCCNRKEFEARRDSQND